MDIRSRPMEEWGRLLRERWPRPMIAELGWAPEESSAINSVAIVMKMVIGYTDSSLRRGGSELPSVRPQVEAERKNVLLKYAWHDTSIGIEKASGVEPQAVRRLQEEVYRELMDRKGPWTPAVSKGITFEGLMESAPMLEHFWSRLELRLYIGLEVEHKDGWVPLRPLMDDGGVVPMSGAGLAERSLVRWSSDKEPLTTCLLGAPDEQGRGLCKVKGWNMGVQECIRVLYEPGLEQDGPGFQELVEVTITPEALQTGQQGARWTEGRNQTYRLIAVVRLGAPERLRTYGDGGRYSVPETLSERNVLCLDSSWELGQAGFQYMLYYTRANSDDPGVASAEETPPSTIRDTVSAVRAELEQMSVGLESIVSPTPPLAAPTQPKADRDRAAGKFHGGKGGPSLSSSNNTPLGPPRSRRFGAESSAGPSGQRNEADDGSPRPLASAFPIKRPAKPQKNDPRRRSDQPGAREGFRKPVVNPNQGPWERTGDPPEYNDLPPPPKKAKLTPQVEPPPQPENPPAKPDAKSTRPPRVAGAWAPGAFSGHQPAENPEKRQRRKERFDYD